MFFKLQKKMMTTNGVWKYPQLPSYLHTHKYLQKKKLFPYPIASECHS